MNKQRLIKLFMDMVQIDSESSEEYEFAEYMLELGQKFGYKSRKDSYNNVYIEIPGKGEPLMINTHMDTVKPGKNIKPILKKIKDKEYIISSGETILGADPKATIAATFEALHSINENKLETVPLLLTYSCQEEQGIPTAEYIQSDIKRCIVPDRGTPIGEILVCSPFGKVFEVHVAGKAAYATTNFNDGNHSILAATEMIQQSRFGNFAKDSAANVGIISGGEMTSVIPDYCSFKGNCYSFSQSKFDSWFDELTNIVSKVDKKFGTKSKIEFLEYFPGFDLGENHELSKLAYEAISNAGLEPVYKKDMAVSNANILNNIGVESVLISYGAEGAHTTNERISVESLEKLTEILTNLFIQ